MAAETGDGRDGDGRDGDDRLPGRTRDGPPPGNPAGTAGLVLSGVSKRYGGRQVVHGIDLLVANGEMVVIVGPSGCGKSTILRMVAGLEDITSGQVLVNGRVVNDLGPGERNVAMVFQNYALYPHMSVRENMGYALKVAGVPRDEIRRRVHEVAEMLELVSCLDRKPRTLSGGQRQRVAMGRAIVRSADLFLFDEPLSNLDARLRGQTRVEIRGLQRRLGVTSLYVTHDQLEAMTLADRMVVMNDGRIEQTGTPGEVYDRPQTLFVAAFTGSPPMNLLPADSPALCGAPPVSLSGERGVVTLGVRPEDLLPCPPEEAFLSGRFCYHEMPGAETLLFLGTPDDRRLAVRLPGRCGLPGQGERIGLRVREGGLHAFDGHGRRIPLPA